MPLLTDKKYHKEFQLACSQILNKQNISAHNTLIKLAEKEQDSDALCSALLYLLAAESKNSQGKNNLKEYRDAGKQFLKLAENNDDSYVSKNAYLCAAKCLLKTGDYDDAQKNFEKYKEIKISAQKIPRPIIIVEDSNVIILKIKIYLNKLGYHDVHSFGTGKEAIEACKRLLESQNPILLLDMGLPDIGGEIVAQRLLELKPDLPIILITADEKSSERVHKTIASGVSGFIQKPFTIYDLEKVFQKIETEEILLKK